MAEGMGDLLVKVGAVTESATLAMRKLGATVRVSTEMLREAEDRADYDAHPCETKYGDGVSSWLVERVPCFIHTRWSERCDPATRFAALFGDRLREAMAAFR